MRQLKDFAAWLGLIAVILGVVFYMPKLVDYINDDASSRATTVSFAQRPSGRYPGQYPGRRNMAMHRTGSEHRAPSNSN
jgi:hypothetical protein